MSIIVTDFEQGSDAWFEARVGSPGASSISKIITSTGTISKQRDDYLYQLAGEKVAGKAEEGYKNQAMINGNEREDGNRKLFELLYDVEVKQCGIVYKDERKLFHCSPDGLIGDNDLLEIKSPQIGTQARLLCERKIKPEYWCQCQMQMFVCERERVHCLSAYEGLPPFIQPVERDDKFIGKLSAALEDFCSELQEVVSKLKAIQ